MYKKSNNRKTLQLVEIEERNSELENKTFKISQWRKNKEILKKKAVFQIYYIKWSNTHSLVVMDTECLTYKKRIPWNNYSKTWQ